MSQNKDCICKGLPDPEFDIECPIHGEEGCLCTWDGAERIGLNMKCAVHSPDPPKLRDAEKTTMLRTFTECTCVEDALGTDKRLCLIHPSVPDLRKKDTVTAELLKVADGELGLNVLSMVQRESVRAYKKHGDGSILSGNRDMAYILACGLEELGEVARAMVEGETPERVIEEMIQCANVMLSGVQAIKSGRVQMENWL